MDSTEWNTVDVEFNIYCDWMQYNTMEAKEFEISEREKDSPWC